MIYERCECGSYESWNSGMPHPRCMPCKKCGTLPASGPSLHQEVIEHDFSAVSKVETDEGEKNLTRCVHCQYTKKQLEKMDEAERNGP